jgi:hypothetical protein
LSIAARECRERRREGKAGQGKWSQMNMLFGVAAAIWVLRKNIDFTCFDRRDEEMSC